MEKPVQAGVPEAEHDLPCDLRTVQGVGVSLAGAQPDAGSGGSQGQTGEGTPGGNEDLPAEKENAKSIKEEKSMRKNAMCDMDCLNCTRPAHRCYGGGKRNGLHVAKYHKMVDGKRGENMPDVVMGKGGKRWH
jgi:hypothetical protein